MAGTLAKWAQAGCEIVSVIITSGDAGSNDPQHGKEYKPSLAKLREREQKAANKTLGVKETVFLGYPDGELEPTLALRKELTRLIRQYKPEVVVIGDPQGVFYGNGYINHPDHRATAQAALPKGRHSRPRRRGSFSPTCSQRGTNRTRLNGSTSTGRKNPIRGWTSHPR